MINKSSFCDILRQKLDTLRYFHNCEIEEKIACNCNSNTNLEPYKNRQRMGVRAPQATGEYFLAQRPRIFHNRLNTFGIWHYFDRCCTRCDTKDHRYL